jgi:glutathione S-transferase
MNEMPDPMSLPILYTFRRCPFAIRARLALTYAQVPVALREVVLRNKPAPMLAISPKGTVPVLQLPGGQVLQESLDIMNWALDQADPDGWRTQGNGEQGQALIDLNDGPFKVLLDRYKYPERHPGHGAHEHRDQAGELFLTLLDHRLRQMRYLGGDRPSLADMAIVPFIRQFAQVDPDWFASAWPQPHTWMQGLVESELFKAVMAKHAPWQPSD